MTSPSPSQHQPTNGVEGGDIQNEVTPGEYDANIALQFGQLMSNAQPTVYSEPTGYPEAEQASRNEVCLSSSGERPKVVSGEGAVIKGKQKDTKMEMNMTASYDLLCEDDPDDFVAVEIPSDSATADSDPALLELTEFKRRGGFLEKLRRNRNMGGVTVITGSRRPRGGGKGGMVAGEEKVMALHEVADDEARVIQGEEVGPGESPGSGLGIAEDNEEEIWEDQEMAQHLEDDLIDARRRHRSNDLVPGEHSPPAGAGSVAHQQLNALLSESHNISHKHNRQYVDPGGGGVVTGVQGEEFQGITAGIGVTTASGSTHQAPIPEQSVSSDMLISMNVGVAPEMSVRQSLHIGLAPGDLQLELPSDEEMAKEASRVRIDSVESDPREFADEDVESSTWCEHRKHIFVLSLSGKPVYSRYGKEDKLVNLFGIMQALVSFVQDDRDNLRSIMAGKHRFVFVCRGPLVCVSVAQERQSETQLAIQLNYVFNQILSVLTQTQLTQIFEKMPGYDLRYLLQGSEKFVDNILNMIDRDPSLTIGGVRCLAMSVSLRQIITSILMQCRTKDVLFALMVVNNQVVTYIKPKDHNLVPIDIHLILNLVDASTSFRSAESWTPICLPKFNSSGFLHAHVSYLPNDSPACLLLFSVNKEDFFNMQECQQRIINKLDKQGCIEMIKDAVKESHYKIDFLQGSEIRHFLYKSRKTSCVTSPQIPPVYSEEEDERRLFSLYMFMHQRLHSEYWPTKILYHVGNKEALLGWRTAGFDLYIVFDPLIVKVQAIQLGNRLIRWISKEEDRLIITSAHTY